MYRAAAVAAFMGLCWMACATVQQAPTDARLVEAQKAFDEGQRLEETGQYAEAVPHIERALELREAVLGQMHPDVARCLNLLGQLQLLQGEFARAELLLQRAVATGEASLGKDHPDVAKPLNTLGVFYLQQGDYGRAESLLKRALAIREAAFGKDHPESAFVLGNLALLYASQARYAKAEPLYERALAIIEASSGKDHPRTAVALSNLAVLYESQGQYERAGLLYQRALSIEETAFGESHPGVAQSLGNLANLHLHQAQYAKAEQLYTRALPLIETAMGENHFKVVDALNALAYLQASQQRIDQAIPLYERAFTLSEEHLRQEVFGFSEERLTSVLLLRRAEEERLYALARSYPDQSEVRRLALTAALLRKGRSAEEIADTSRIIYLELEPADREKFELLRDLRTQIAALSLAGPGQFPPTEYQRRLKELAEQGNSLEADLARRSEKLRMLHALPPPAELLGRVAATLPEDGVLVEFVAYNDSPLISPFAPPGAPGAQDPGALRYLALLLFADGSTHTVDLGAAAPIDAAALRMTEAFARRASAYLPTAQELYNLAFRPLVPYLGKAQRLFLAPDGQLSLVPFAALHDGRRFLVDAWNITYLTSGKDVLLRPKAAPLEHSVVVLADPSFGPNPVSSSLITRASPVERSASLERFFSTLRSGLTQQPWPSLPGTQQEARAIQRLFPQAQLLLGPAATKQALLTLKTPGILHIATHGFFLEDASAATSTRAVVQPTLLDVGPAHLPPDPLLRSGLVLAEESRFGTSHLEDSLVTALELAGLDLWGTQLVVLSACDTGRGDVKLGQGVYGLRRALVVAGAETVVTSLWKVNDETTSELMERYYRHLLAGQGRTTALREAMKDLRRKNPHPYFWAPFIAIGQDAPLQGLASPPHSERRARVRWE